ncbi:MAG: Spy/CpxP family protein refolding chaperone [Myxococcota bacterium]
MNSTRMKTSRTLAPLILILFVSSLFVVTEAWSKPRRHDRKAPDAFPNKLLEEVGVDETVRAEISSLSESSEVQARNMHQEIHDARKGLRGLLEEEAPDPALVMKQVDTIGALEIKADKHRLSTMLSIRALLTPEQRAELEELHEVHRDKRHGRKMRKVKRACEETLMDSCSGAQSDREQIECLRGQALDTSEACQTALRKLHRPEHPRLGRKSQDTPDPMAQEG